MLSTINMFWVSVCRWAYIIHKFVSQIVCWWDKIFSETCQIKYTWVSYVNQFPKDRRNCCLTVMVILVLFSSIIFDLLLLFKWHFVSREKKHIQEVHVQTGQIPSSFYISLIILIEFVDRQRVSNLELYMYWRKK